MKLNSLAGLTAAGLAFAAGHAQAQGPAAAAVDEILVTAERRSRPISDVPVAVTALTGREIEALSIDTLPELVRTVPGVQLQMRFGAARPNYVIRGVALLDYNANNAPAASVYVDDVYQASTAMGGLSLFDLNRVEVIKGPQSGLFGRDTSGGAIQVISRRPEFDAADGYLTAGFGRWNTWNVEGGTTVALSDAVAIRLSALHERGQGGWQYSLTDQRHWGAPDRSAARLQVRLAPNERLDVNLKLEATYDGSEIPLARSIALYSPTGTFCTAALQGRRDDAGCLNLSQATRLLRRLPPGPSSAVQAADGSTTLSRAFNRLSNRGRSGVLSATYRFDGFDVTSVTGYNFFRYGQNYDFSATPSRLGLQVDRSNIQSWSQEVRIASNTDSRLNWLIGATWARDEFSDDREIDIRENLQVVQALGIPDPSRAFLQLAYDQDTRYAAVFAQADYRLTDTVRLSGAIRYSEHTKRYYNGLVGVARPYIIALSNLESRYELEEPFSGRLSLDWRASDDALLFASISRGYKSGGIFGGFNTIAGQITPYREETVWAYETGFRSGWWENRLQLNGALFYYDYADVQGFTNVLFPIGGLPFAYPLLTNIADANHYGAELDATWRPLSGLTLQAGAAYLDARYRDTDIATISPEQLRVPLTGRRRPFAPRWSGFLLARYETPITERLSAAAQIDANFRSDLTFPNTAVERAIGAVGGFSLVNGRVTLALAPQNLALSFWSRNLTNERYRLELGSDGLGSYTETFGEPRSYGVEITKRW